MAGLLGSVALIVVATAVIWKGSAYFEQAAERLSRYYGLPVAVHGAIVVAVGSSFPEISSVVISTVVHDEFSLGVGAIVGSAIFNLLVIPAFSAYSTEELKATRDIVHKDAQFYIISVLVLFIMFALGATYVPGGTNSEARLTRVLAVLPIATYGIYVFLHQQDASEYAALTFGDAFGTPSFLWGLTVIAAATSLPDAFVSINAAKDGESVTSITNVL